MDSYAHFTDIPHTMPMSDVSTPSYEAYDPSLPTDHPFVTRATQFQLHVSPMDESKAPGASLAAQPWWKAEEQSFGMGYIPPDLTYAERFSPWNSGISTISDPQSPRSSNSGSVPAMNCIASAGFRQEDIAIGAVDEQTSYPAPNGLVDIDYSSTIAKPRVFEIQPDHRSPYDPDFDAWSGTQSDRNVTPDQQLEWPSPVPGEVSFPAPTRRSRHQQTTSTSTSTSTSRIRKSSTKRATSTQGRTRRRRGTTSTSENNTPRTFVCSFAAYGCESTFVSKNEWKRHVTSQHLQLGFYRCDVGKCSAHTQTSPNHFLTPSPSPNPRSRSRTATPPPGQPNDFNRKDLFTQHQRRMHAPWLSTGRRRSPTDSENNSFEASLEKVRQRCWYGLRQAPTQSHCGFCREEFSGEGSWDARMEHVGRHFERDDRQCLGEELEDVALREWGLYEGILTLVDGQCRLASLVGLEM